MPLIDISLKMREYSEIIENELKSYLEHDGNLYYAKIFDAVKYSTFTDGKRLRPIIMLEFARICGGDIKKILPFACALEMIHTYSLIHDDLPCMDDDDLRRGKPTLHKVYDEAIAVLAGDALLTYAFEMASTKSLERGTDPKLALSAIAVLSKNAGMNGMIGGQVIDMLSENTDIPYEKLLALQNLKTGALLKSSAIIGTLLAGGTKTQIDSAEVFAGKLGLAFQIRDDILDIEGDEQKLGKPIGSDEQNNKATFPSILGMEKCKKLVKELTSEAIDSLDNFENTEFLKALAIYLIDREN